MTEMTVPAAARPSQRVRRAGLGWNTVRQHRLVLTGLAIVFAGFALRLALTGIPLHATYGQYLSQHCVTQRHSACGRLLNAMGGSWITSFAGLAVLPGLIGVFVGAPLVAHDFETGSYRFGFAQSVSWRRQLVAKLLVIGAIVLIGSSLLGLLTMWCLAPFHRIGLGYDSGISQPWPLPWPPP
jgi:ABC-type transport system involved in multi-copper enzyme maturation permease subunit